MLDGFNDDDVREIRGLCDKVLKSRDEDRKANALEEAREKARAILSVVGLRLEDLVKAKAKAAKGPSYKGGQVYQHPTNKALTWQAKGKKPKWLVELESEGERPIEMVGAVAENAGPLRKAV